nr:tRNA(fMet)-specific endonuclease VapC [uncultured bacterium]
MSEYLDTSILVALFVDSDPFTERAKNYLSGRIERLVVSDFAAAEFASVMARLTRTRRLTVDEATAILGDFDTWKGRAAELATTSAADIAAAASFLRRLDLNLRTPDAINIAIADRLRATLATFDDRMAIAARALGVQVASV